jgi:LmbE family N-acetylglucosaminyl deacetylase
MEGIETVNNKPFKLMCVLAHPDDESLATGGILAKYAALGVQTYLVMATRGERGWFGPADENPGLDALGQLREGELRAAARALGLREVIYLDYLDGDLDRVNHARAIAKIVTQLRRIKPDVVVTFDQNGMYGHPDHIAISQMTTTAVMAAADPFYQSAAISATHRVAKLYYRAYLQAEQESYEATFGRLEMPVDSMERRFTTWPEWAVTTKVDVSAYRKQVWQAIMCHRSQLPTALTTNTLPDHMHTSLWKTQTYYRAMSMVNGGREMESELFDGLCQRVPTPRLYTIPQQLVAVPA